MKADYFINFMKDFMNAQPKGNVLLLIDGEKFPITDIRGGSPITLYSNKKSTHVMSAFKVLEAIEHYYHQGHYFEKNKTIEIRKKEDSNAYFSSRTIQIEEVYDDNNTFIIVGHYLEEGDHILIEFESDYYGSTFYAGTVWNLKNKYEEEECFQFKDGFAADFEGDIDVHAENLLVNENITFDSVQFSRIKRYYTTEEWIMVQKQLQIAQVLRAKLPFLNANYMTELLDELIKIK